MTRPVRGAAVVGAAAVVLACGEQTSEPVLGEIPENLRILSGNNQFDTPGSPLPRPFEVLVTDSADKPVPAVAVDWRVILGGGAFEFAGDRTDIGGKVLAHFVLGPDLGTYEVRAVLAGDTTRFVTFLAFATIDGRPPDSPPPIAVVTVGDNFFRPSEVTSVIGRGVKWVWQGENLHDLTFDDPLVLSPVPGGGTPSAKREGSFTASFNRTGTFTYFCSIHGREAQSGRVVVTS